ncbi:MAG: ABC transporter permease [Gammaproteobacteria bacterium]
MPARLLIAKVGWAVFTLAFVLVLNFFLFRALPGDPARAGLRDARLSLEVQQALRVRFGLDKPLVNCIETLRPLRLGGCAVNPLDTQLLRYAINLARGDLGVSYHSRRPVAEILAERLGNTLLLLGAGSVLAILLGIALGVVAAWRAGSGLDSVLLGASLIGWSLPTFWLGILLLFWGSAQWGLPLAGKSTPGASFANQWDTALDIGRHLLLPTLTFAIVTVAEYLLITRSALLGVLNENFILIAKAKGLSTYHILKDHALRAAALPLVSLIALNLGFTVAGAIQIETVFSWPGLGQAMVEAVAQRDYPLLQGAFLLLSACVIGANLLAELLYMTLDPRLADGAGSA